MVFRLMPRPGKAAALSPAGGSDRLSARFGHENGLLPSRLRSPEDALQHSMTPHPPQDTAASQLAPAPILSVSGLWKRFSGVDWVVRDFELSVGEGEILSILGPSGCGKTTLLRLIAGFETPERGEIHNDGKLISRPGWGVPPEQRRLGMVFQEYTLFPHLTSVRQPLGGEYAARREILEQVPFSMGYGVETGLLIDIAEMVGLDRLAQVDLGVRVHRNRPLDELSVQAMEVLHTALRRADIAWLPEWSNVLERPDLDPVHAQVDERPPLATVREYLELRSATS